MLNKQRRWLLLVLILGCIRTFCFASTSGGPAAAFALLTESTAGRASSRRERATAEDVATTTTTTTTNKQQPVFPQWFEDSHPKTFVSPQVKVAEFGNGLRGISWPSSSLSSSSALDKEQQVMIARVPKAMTMQADYTRDDWDIQLATQLVEKIQDKKHNTANTAEWEGYLASLPDQPAPHAIRHWTPPQRQRLAHIPAGQRLLDAADKQVQGWRDAYDSNKLYYDNKDDSQSQSEPSQQQISWENFQWALETVNSRAYCGLSSTSGVLWRSVGAPLLAAAVVGGIVQSDTTILLNNDDDGQVAAALLVGLFGLLSTLPTVLQIVQKEKSQLRPELVYLLPFFDLFNHRDNVKTSSIKWDPLQQHFSMMIGPDCLVQEQNDGQTQIYINYGSKSDSEWLLNFGFLPSITEIPAHNVSSSEDDLLRRLLAQEFVRRNC